MQPTRKYELYSSEFRSQAHEVYSRMRTEDPVILQPGLDGKTPIWFITRYSDVEQVLLDDRRFARDAALAYTSEEMERIFGPSDPAVDALVNNHMLNRDGDDHRRLRSLVGKAFTPRVIQSMQPRIEQIAQELLDEVADRGCMELISEFAFPLPITVIAELLGIPMDNREQFRSWSNAFVRPAITPEEQRESNRMLAEMLAYMQGLVAERRSKSGSDLLSGLIHAEEQGDRLSESELFSMISLLIVAGHETTVSLIGNAVLALLQQSEALKDLRGYPERISSTIEELLRYDSPVERALTRFVTEDTQLGGQALKRGDLVIAIIGSANRDEDKFSSAAELLLERKPNPHLAFGKGAHYCLGAPLARLEGEIALRALFSRFPDLRLDIHPDDLEWRDVPLFRSLERLPVRWGSA